MAYRTVGLFLLLCALVPLGCHPQKSPDDDAAAVSDASDTRDDTPSDVADGSGEVHDSSDRPDTSNALYDPALWMRDNSCTGETTFPSDFGEFENPPPPDDYTPTKTYDDWIASRGELPLQGFSFGVDPKLMPRDQRPFELFAEPGTDIQLFITHVNNYTDEELESFRHTTTVLVDYEPVEATYQRWSPNRETMVDEVVSTGFHFDVTEKVEIIEITIPASAFPESRTYEIALASETTTTVRRSVGKNFRFALFNGGCDRPTRPCHEPALSDEATEFEQRLFRRISDDVASIFFEGISNRDELRSTIDVQPGETRRIFVSLYSNGFEEREMVLRPLLNGKPLDHTWWVTHGNRTGEGQSKYIDARKSFEVTFPEEPGIYEVQVASWLDPFELYRTPDGTEHDDIESESPLSENSNALRFRVVEETE
jgi:hypothetical protein